MENVIAHTDARLANWYVNAKNDFGVIGSGYSKFNSETNEVEIYYTENGVDYCFKHYWHEDFKIDTIFWVWTDEANPENDKIEQPKKSKKVQEKTWSSFQDKFGKKYSFETYMDFSCFWFNLSRKVQKEFFPDNFNRLQRAAADSKEARTPAIISQQ